MAEETRDLEHLQDAKNTLGHVSVNMIYRYSQFCYVAVLFKGTYCSGMLFYLMVLFKVHTVLFKGVLHFYLRYSHDYLPIELITYLQPEVHPKALD